MLCADEGLAKTFSSLVGQAEDVAGALGEAFHSGQGSILLND
jgi:hypothetical protein